MASVSTSRPATRPRRAPARADRAASSPFLRVGAATALLMLQSCLAFPQGAPGTWPGTWPPVGAQCNRNDNVPFAMQATEIGKELTRLHADRQCVPQPGCGDWMSQEHQRLPGASSGAEWLGYTNHRFDIAEQNTIIANARANAIARTPPGKQFYSLTFSNDIIVASGPSSGVIFATAHYGRCRFERLDTSTPRGTQEQ